MGIIYATLFCYILFILQIVLAHLKLRKKVLFSHKKRSSKTVISSIFLTVFFTLFTSELILQCANPTSSLLPSFFTHKLSVPPVFTVLGTFLLMLSVIGLFSTLSSFGDSLRFGLDSNRLGKFVSHGIFKYSRNPFFVSILLHLIGMAFVFSSVFFILVAISAVLSIHFFILKEERFMRKNYGEEYKQYCNVVRRYF